MMAVFDQFDAGKKPRGAFEKALHKALGGLDDDGQDALRDGFRQIEELSERQRACIFDYSIADRLKDRPLDPNEILVAIVGEGLAEFGDTFLRNSQGQLGPGQTRNWDQIWQPPPNGSQTPQTYTGPWPWLTAVRPDVTNYSEFGNRVSYDPSGKTGHTFEEYQFEQNCVYSVDPNKPGQLTAKCDRLAPPPIPGSMFPPMCKGEEPYTEQGACLLIPGVQPGAAIALRGFNFITPTVHVLLASQNDPSVKIEVEATVWGDRETPQNDASGSVIADGRVEDAALLAIPDHHPTNPAAPLPPGTYEVTVFVDNVTNTAYHGNVSPRLRSNTLLLNVEPDKNMKFNLFSDHGHCYEETDGLGSDEIWFDAWTGHIVPQQSASGGLDIPTLKKTEFDRGAWDDMDSGDDPGGYSANLWDGQFGLGGVLVVGLIGFEVDSEAAAREQLRSFGDAFGYYLKEVVGYIAGLGGLASGIAALVKITVSLLVAVIAVIIVVFVIAIIGAIWAAWAPADRIATDVFSLDGLKAWSLTQPNVAIGPDEHLQFDEVATTHHPIGPDPTISPSARYRFEHRYQTPSDGEDSDYGIEFKLTRK